MPATHRFGAELQQDCELVFTAPLDGFTTRLKVSVIAGAVFTAPLWLYQLWAFVTPGLRKNERKYTIDLRRLLDCAVRRAAWRWPTSYWPRACTMLIDRGRLRRSRAR